MEFVRLLTRSDHGATPQQRPYDYDARYSDGGPHAISTSLQRQSANGSPPSSADSSPQNAATGGQPRTGRVRAQTWTNKLQSLVAGKSTAHITQQQLNKKRQRATPEQLAVLEEAFEVNPSPNAKQRETISAQIDMTERSVQIWFQNRRAKTKSASKRLGGASDDIFQSRERSGNVSRSLSIDQGMLLDHDQGGQHLARLNCRSLTIGTWRRVACTPNDLVLYFSQVEPRFTYYINSGSSGFKLEFPLAAISKLDLKFLDGQVSKELGRITLEIIEPPVFFMEVPGSGTWSQCTDFTEHQQATLIQTHLIVGSYAALKSSMTDLARAHPSVAPTMTFADVLQSQPAANDYSTQPDPELFALAGQQAASAMEQNQHPTMTPRGGMHRRQRSRSAPIALDFSFLHGEHVGGMPNYSFGQRSARPDANYGQVQHAPPPQTQQLQQVYPGMPMQGNMYAAAALAASQAMTPATDYPEMLFTPTTSSSAVFNDGNALPGWYGSHATTGGYAESPLLNGTGAHSGLTSPMVPNGGGFDMASQVSLVSGIQPQPQHSHPSVTAMNDFMLQDQNAGPSMMNFPAHSMPDLLSGIPEAAALEQQSALDQGMTGLEAAGSHSGDISLGGSMHGAGIQNAQLAAMVAMNMEANAMIAQQAQQEQEAMQIQDHVMQ